MYSKLLSVVFYFLIVLQFIFTDKRQLDIENSKILGYENALLEQDVDGSVKIVPLSDQSEMENINSQDISNLQDGGYKTNSTMNSTSLNGINDSIENCQPEIETKDDSLQVLQKIMTTLAEIKKQRALITGQEGFPCQINGSWVSLKGGIVLKIICRTSGCNLTLTSTIPQKNGIFTKNWNAGHVEAPFATIGYPFTLSLVDHNEKKLAVFVGQCRICFGGDTIMGFWTISRLARDAKDLFLANELYVDLFHRECLHNLREEKIQEIKNKNPLT